MGMSASDSQFHVLAVDDNLIDRKLIEKLLKTSSYQVTTVDSGTKALEFLGWHEDGRFTNNSSNETLVSSNNHHQEVEVNLVITDYCMPGMTGYDLLKKIKESSNLRNIPVVIMSSENVPSRINRCLEEGAEEFFLKPVTPSDVNKLKPHMMKTKCKNDDDVQKPENMEKQESSAEDDQVNVTEASIKKSQSQQHQTTQSNIIATSNNNNNNNDNNSKRKSLEEGLSPQRTRPRYNNGLTVMSN